MLVKQINVVSIVRGEEEKGGDLRDAACCPLLSTYDLGTHLSYDSCIFFHASPIRPLLAQPTLLRACHGGWVGGLVCLPNTNWKCIYYYTRFQRLHPARSLRMAPTHLLVLYSSE